MTRYKANDFQQMIGLTTVDLSLSNTEKFIDAALGLLNLYQAGLPERMGGTAGDKRVTVDTSQWAAVVTIAKMVYVDFLEDAGGNMDIQGLSLRASNLLVKPEFLALVQSLATQCGRVGKNPYGNIRLI